MWLFKKKIDTTSIISEIYKKDRLKRYSLFILGLLIVSLSYNTFLLPNNIVFGGVSGIAIIVKHFFDIEASTTIMIGSLFLLLISYIFLGREKTRGSVMGSVLFPVFVELTSALPGYIDIDTSQLLLSALFGGVTYGFGIGLVLKAGFTTGGTDILNQILHKYVKISVGNATLINDGIIVLSSVFFFGVNKLMYALVVLYLRGLITDKVLLGISDSKAFYIIAEKEEEIKDFILNSLNHGVTIFNAQGGYTNEKQKVLMCVIPTKEYFKLKEGIHEIDPTAFFVVTDAYEVFGGE